MSKRLTNEEITVIRERADKAVYAPWRIGKQSPNGLYNVGSTDGLLTAQTTNEANAAFIAHARQDIPKLLAEIERLREKLGEADSLLSDAQSLMGKVHCYDTDEYRAIWGYFDGGDSG